MDSGILYIYRHIADCLFHICRQGKASSCLTFDFVKHLSYRHTPELEGHSCLFVCLLRYFRESGS